METEYQQLHPNSTNLKRINKILIILLTITCILLIGITIVAAISINSNNQDTNHADNTASFSPTVNPTPSPTIPDNTEYCPRYPIPIYLNISIFNSILQKVDKFIENVTAHIPGFTVTIVYNQQQIFTKGYGKVNYSNDSSRPPNGNDLVEIGSVTKIFTSLLTYYLRDQNMLSLDDPITKYLPNFSIKSNYNTNKPLITLRQLASHSSGLQRDAPECPWHSINCNESKILKTLSNRYLILPQYKTYHYSNLGFALLGRGIEKIFCDGCYENILKTYILNGLNFSKLSGFNYSDEILQSAAIGNIYNKIKGWLPSPRTTLSWINPTGGLLVTVNDMAKLIMFLFRNNTNNQILDGSTINEILSPQILLNDLSQIIGLPFEMTFETFNTSNGIKSVWFRGKQGALSGFRSSLMLIPEYKLGIFTNALVSNVWDDYVWTNHILHMILPFLDNILSKKYLYVLPNNYKLLIGNYKCKNETNSICGNAIMNINITNGRLMMNKYQRVLTIFDENINNILRVYKEIKQTCVHLDASDAELIYFNFENGNNIQATAFTFMEGKYKLIDTE